MNVLARELPPLEVEVSVLELQFPTVIDEWRASTSFGKLELEPTLRIFEFNYLLIAKKPYVWMEAEDARIRATLCTRYGL